MFGHKKRQEAIRASVEREQAARVEAAYQDDLLTWASMHYLDEPRQLTHLDAEDLELLRRYDPETNAFRPA